MPKNKKLALNSGIQNYQILATNDESLYSIPFVVAFNLDS